MINVETMTREQVLEAAREDKDLMKMLGGESAIQERELTDLRIFVKMHVILNNEVGAFYDKNGF